MAKLLLLFWGRVMASVVWLVFFRRYFRVTWNLFLRFFTRVRLVRSDSSNSFRDFS